MVSLPFPPLPRYRTPNARIDTVPAVRRVKGQFCSLGVLLCASDRADVRINSISTGRPEGYRNMDKRCQRKLPTTASSSGKIRGDAVGDDGEVT